MNKKFITDSLILFFIGVFSSLSLPPMNYFVVNFFTFSIFFGILFKNLNIRPNKFFFFYYGWLFGFGYFLASLYWITISLTFDKNFIFLIPIALILIPAFLGIFYGVVTFIFYLFNFKGVISTFFLFSLLMGLAEFARGQILTGFPWNLIVYSFSKNLNFISLLSIVGTYSLNLISISFFTAPAIYFLRKSKKEIIVLVILIFTPILSSSYGIFYEEKFLGSEIKKNQYVVRVIGSNISLERFYDKTEAKEVINQLIKISSPEEKKKTFFLWPEGIIPNTYQDQLFLYGDLFKKNFNEKHLIGLGITSRLLKENNFEYFNSFSVFDKNLDLIQKYNKVNLVPFGEFLPFENFLNEFGLKTITNNIGSFTKGDKRKIIEVGDELDRFKFLPLICYEIIYSGKLTENFDFDFIFNISEDGWFGKSIGPKQHFTHSIFRAIENGKYVIRSSNNGMTAIINPLGRIEGKIDYGKAGFVDFEQRRDLEPTLFSIFGNKIFILFILLYIFLIFFFNRNKNE